VARHADVLGGLEEAPDPHGGVYQQGTERHAGVLPFELKGVVCQHDRLVDVPEEVPQALAQDGGRNEGVAAHRRVEQPAVESPIEGEDLAVALLPGVGIEDVLVLVVEEGVELVEKWIGLVNRRCGLVGRRGRGRFHLRLGCRGLCARYRGSEHRAPREDHPKGCEFDLHESPTSAHSN